uniref:Plantacyanin n=1 Tax=Ananas comosus var. bracteatus TaxID=296719 RepID=A0A6V7P7B6_ANACO|nr:unnamed protein product [Ananas comosus var. bracteatus]
MAQGRGSANHIVALGVLLLLCILINGPLAESTVYNVGDASGWTFNTVGWTNGKTFKAGDVLVFKYNPNIHNVVAVNAAAYKSCTVPAGARVFKSGNDRIRLRKGTHRFICGSAGHCNAGMKIAVRVV